MFLKKQSNRIMIIRPYEWNLFDVFNNLKVFSVVNGYFNKNLFSFHPSYNIIKNNIKQISLRER